MKPVRDLVFWYLKKKNLTAVPARPGPKAAPPTLTAAFERLRKRKLRLGTVLDVGASDGHWTAQLLTFQPKARYLCVEAQPAHQPALQNLAAAHPQVQYVMCAAGEREGETFFDAADLFGGVVLAERSGSDSISVPMRTLDALVAEYHLPAPFLIKLDTHGYELPILAGASRTLHDTVALIVEVYNFPNGPLAVPFHEFCRLMAAQGFRCIDLFDPLYRARDGAFWQMDLMFLKETRPEFQYLGYT